MHVPWSRSAQLILLVSSLVAVSCGGVDDQDSDGEDDAVAESATAPTSFNVGYTSATPTKVLPGQSLSLSTKAQAKNAGGTAVVAAEIARVGGPAIWSKTWDPQAFGPWKTRDYAAKWAVPSDQESGDYQLTIRVTSTTATDLAAPRVVKFKIGAAPTAVSSNPSQDPDPDQSPDPGEDAADIPILGSGAFVANIKAGLEQMKQKSPADYAVFTTYVKRVSEGPNWAYVATGFIQISTSSASLANWVGGAIVHEAVHVKNYKTGNFPYIGCEGEAKSLTAQAKYLDKIGAHDFAQQVKALIGEWC